MSATDRLFFPPTGEETSCYILVQVAGGDATKLRASSSLERPSSSSEGAESPPEFVRREGDLADVLGAALEFAEPLGYPVRVRLGEGVVFPSELGTYAERRIET